MDMQRASMWRERVVDWDIAGCLYLNAYCRRRDINRFFAAVSRLGDGVFWYSLAAILPLVYGEKGLEASAYMIATGLVCLVIYKDLKSRLVRERPFIRSDKIFQGCAPLDYYSFPSGHTMHAVCFSTIAIYHFPVLAAILVPFTLLIALSRIVLGMHYPSDVLCGFALGLLLGGLSNYLFEPYALFAPGLSEQITDYVVSLAHLSASQEGLALSAEAR